MQGSDQHIIHESQPFPPRCDLSLEHNSRGTNWAVRYSCADPEQAMRVITELYARLEKLYGSAGR